MDVGVFGEIIYHGCRHVARTKDENLLGTGLNLRCSHLSVFKRIEVNKTLKSTNTNKIIALVCFAMVFLIFTILFTYYIFRVIRINKTNVYMETLRALVPNYTRINDTKLAHYL